EEALRRRGMEKAAENVGRLRREMNREKEKRERSREQCYQNREKLFIQGLRKIGDFKSRGAGSLLYAPEAKVRGSSAREGNVSVLGHGESSGAGYFFCIAASIFGITARTEGANEPFGSSFR